MPECPRASPATANVDAVLDGLVGRGLGPVLAAFGRWCAAQVRREHGADRIFGIEREGRLLSRMAEPFGIAASSLHLSRRIGLVATLGSVDEEGLTNLLVRARARPATLGEASDLLGIECPDVAGADAPVAIRPLLDHLRTSGEIAAVRERSRQVREGLLAYLAAMGVRWDDTPLVLADLGYAGNIQRTLIQCLRLVGIGKPVVGLYLVTSPGIAWARRAGGIAAGRSIISSWTVRHAAGAWRTFCVGGGFVRARGVLTGR